MDSLTQRHVGYLETYLMSLSSHNSTWRTSIKGTGKDTISESSNIQTLLQQHHPQIISDEKAEDDISPPLNITWTKEGGRHLVASRDVKVGEVLFWEPPILMAPKAGGGPTCLSCLRSLPESFSTCAECGAPLCVPPCDGTGHTTKECKALKGGLKLLGKDSEAEQEETNRNNDNHSNEVNSEEDHQNLLKKVKLLNCLMTPLRTILLMQDSSSASDVIASMQSNAEQRSKMPIGKFLENQYTLPLKTFLGSKLPRPVLHHVCGIWDTNAFEMRLSHGGVGRGLLPIAGLMNHSCVPNTQHWTYQGGLMVMASTDIPKGTPLTNNYVNTLLGTFPRQSHLLATKLFLCSCRRCSDPTELGSNASALICRGCKTGLMLPPEDGRGSWRCNSCTEDLPYERVCMMIQMAGKMISASQRQDMEDKKNILRKIRSMLGEQHYLSKELQAHVLGDIMQQPIQDVNIEDLKYAYEIAKDMMKFINIIDPGYTRFKGLFILRQIQIKAELLRRCACENRTLEFVLAEEVAVEVEENTNEEDVYKSHQLELKALTPLVSFCSGILKYDEILDKELRAVKQKLEDLQAQFERFAPAVTS